MKVTKQQGRYLWNQLIVLSDKASLILGALGFDVEQLDTPQPGESYYWPNISKQHQKVASLLRCWAAALQEEVDDLDPPPVQERNVEELQPAQDVPAEQPKHIARVLCAIHLIYAHPHGEGGAWLCRQCDLERHNRAGLQAEVEQLKEENNRLTNQAEHFKKNTKALEAKNEEIASWRRVAEKLMATDDCSIHNTAFTFEDNVRVCRECEAEHEKLGELQTEIETLRSKQPQGGGQEIDYERVADNLIEYLGEEGYGLTRGTRGLASTKTALALIKSGLQDSIPRNTAAPSIEDSEKRPSGVLEGSLNYHNTASLMLAYLNHTAEVVLVTHSAVAGKSVAIMGGSDAAAVLKTALEHVLKGKE